MAKAAFGIKDRIRKAMNVAEIFAAVKDGAKFKDASDKTRRCWVKLTDRRTAELAKAEAAKKVRKGETATA